MKFSKKSFLLTMLSLLISNTKAKTIECNSVDGAIRIHHFQVPNLAKPNEISAILNSLNGDVAELNCVKTTKNQFRSSVMCIGRTMFRSTVVRARIDQVNQKTISGITANTLGVVTYSDSPGADLVSINSTIPINCK